IGDPISILACKFGRRHINLATSYYEGDNCDQDIECHYGKKALRPPQMTSAANHAHGRLLKVSKAILCYPLLYILFTLPTAIIRLGQFSGKPWSLTTAFIVVDINILLGFCNVIVYTMTRKG